MGIHSTISEWRRRYRFVGPPSISLPTKSVSEIASQSRRRTEPFALISTRIPEGLVRGIAAGSISVSGMLPLPSRHDAALPNDNALDGVDCRDRTGRDPAKQCVNAPSRLIKQ